MLQPACAHKVVGVPYLLVKLAEIPLSSGAAAEGAAAAAVVGAGASVVATCVSAAPQPDNSTVMTIIAAIRA